MPRYTITDPQTGRTLKIDGDSPPSEAEIEQLFAQTAPQAAPQDVQPSEPPPVPEMVPMAAPRPVPSVGMGLGGMTVRAPSPAQTQQADVSAQKEAQIRAANLQAQLGLSEPVNSQGNGLGMADRAMLSISPSPEATQAAMEQRPGGGFIPVSAKNALIRVPDGKGGMEWVVQNPQGFDLGDLAAFAAKIPEIGAGIAANFATKLPMANAAAGAAASNAVGALTDVAFLKLNNLPVDAEEIAKRRGINLAVETGLGWFGNKLAPVAVNEIQKRGIPFLADSPSKAAEKALRKEGDAAKRFLRGMGVAPETAGQVGEATRNAIRGTGDAAEAGEIMAKVLTAQERKVALEAEQQAELAARQLKDRVSGFIDRSTTPNVVLPSQAGAHVVASAKQVIESRKAAAGKMFEDALAQVDSELSASGVAEDFVKLPNSAKLIQEVKSSLLKKLSSAEPPEPVFSGVLGISGERLMVPGITPPPETSKLYAPLLSTLNELEGSVTLGQKLKAVRGFKSYVGERLRSGSDEVFPGMTQQAAKRLYGALTKDIDQAIDSIGGQGGAMLKAANANYKALVESVDDSPFMSKLLTGGYDNPFNLISDLSNPKVAGPTEWKLLQDAVGPQTFAGIRKSVINSLSDSATVRIGAREVQDVSRLSDNLAGIPTEIKDSLFGGSAAWKAIEETGKAFKFLKERKGIFSSAAFPTKAEIGEAARIAQLEGYTKGKSALTQALSLANKRRDVLSDSMVSQLLTGNTKNVVENPAAFFDSVVYSGNYSPKRVQQLMGKLAPQEREVVANAAWERLFEDARPKVMDHVASKLAKASTQYEYDKIARSLLGSSKDAGSKEQREAIRAVLGDRRYQTAEALVRYQHALAVEMAISSKNTQDFQKLVSKAYFPNLFMAQVAATAMQKASAISFMKNANPQDAVAFVTRWEEMRGRNPLKAELFTKGLGIAAQTVARNQLWGDYVDMMEGLNEDQQLAINNYLTGRQ